MTSAGQLGGTRPTAAALPRCVSSCSRTCGRDWQRGSPRTSSPGELPLVQQYGVSRHTVREALRQLRAEGTVTAARGRQPRLGPVEITQPIGALASLFSVVEQQGLEQRSLVRRLDVRADGVIATRLGLDGSTPLLHLERLRLAGGAPPVGA